MKKYFLILVLITLVVPSVALASWWNPVTWFNNWSFYKQKTTLQTQEINNNSTSNSLEQVKKLQEPVDELKKEKLSISNKTNEVKEVIPRTTAPLVTQTPGDQYVNFLDAQLERVLVENQQKILKLQQDYNAFKEEKKPFEERLDVLAKEIKDCPVGEFGAKLRQCKAKGIEIIELSARIVAIQNTFNQEQGFQVGSPAAINTNITDTLGKSYTFFYDVNTGGGFLTNNYNSMDSYSVYCSGGRCDIHGN